MVEHFHKSVDVPAQVRQEFERDLDAYNDRLRASLLAYKAFDPNQPRDDHGRWGSGGGSHTAPPVVGHDLPGYVAPTVSSALEAYENSDHVMTTPEEVVAIVPGYKAALDAAEAKITAAGYNQTQEQHMVDGKYTAERTAVHDKILADTFSPEKVAAATPKEGEQPTLILLGGRAGSGKSWFTESADSPLEHPEKYMVINSDNFKEALPGYEGWNAGLLHEESSDMLSRATTIAREAGLNVIVDATMKSPGTGTRLIEEYRAAGYRIEGYYMHSAPRVSAVRAAERFLKSGRYVPPSYVLKSTTNEKTFDGLASKMDRWSVYDSNGGFPPRSVAGYKKNRRIY